MVTSDEGEMWRSLDLLQPEMVIRKEPLSKVHMLANFIQAFSVVRCCAVGDANTWQTFRNGRVGRDMA